MSGPVPPKLPESGPGHKPGSDLVPPDLDSDFMQIVPGEGFLDRLGRGNQATPRQKFAGSGNKERPFVDSELLAQDRHLQPRPEGLEYEDEIDRIMDGSAQVADALWSSPYQPRTPNQFQLLQRGAGFRDPDDRSDDPRLHAKGLFIDVKPVDQTDPVDLPTQVMPRTEDLEAESNEPPVRPWVVERDGQVTPPYGLPGSLIEQQVRGESVGLPPTLQMSAIPTAETFEPGPHFDGLGAWGAQPRPVTRERSAPQPDLKQVFAEILPPNVLREVGQPPVTPDPVSDIPRTGLAAAMEGVKAGRAARADTSVTPAEEPEPAEPAPGVYIQHPPSKHAVTDIPLATAADEKGLAASLADLDFSGAGIAVDKTGPGSRANFDGDRPEREADDRNARNQDANAAAARGELPTLERRTRGASRVSPEEDPKQ